jgi:adenine-specific DNA-methyltransferase
MSYSTHGVKYIGSKAALLEEIQSFISTQLPSTATGTARTLIDVFTGTTRVAQSFRAAGWTVISSDLSWASEAYANAFLLRTPHTSARIPALLAELKATAAAHPADAPSGWIETNYCDVIAADGGIVKMWKPKNGRAADVIRDTIAAITSQ